MLEQFPISIFENEKIIIASESKYSLDLSALEDKKVLIFMLPNQNQAENESNILKIFNACGFFNNEILISQELIPWSEILKSKNIKEIFLFGIAPKDIAIHYNIFPYSFMPINNRMLVLADAIKVIMNNQQLKADFWNKCLKPYYKK